MEADSVIDKVKDCTRTERPTDKGREYQARKQARKCIRERTTIENSEDDITTKVTKQTGLDGEAYKNDLL